MLFEPNCCLVKYCLSIILPCLERHLIRRDVFKQNRSAALAEWRQLTA